MMVRATAAAIAMLFLVGCDDDEGKDGKVEGQASVTLSDGRVAEITVVVKMAAVALILTAWARHTA